MAKTIVAIFDVFENAEKAAYEIRNKGLRTDNISIIVKDSGNKGYYKPSNKTETMQVGNSGLISYKFSKRERISDGLITGGIFGGLFGILIGAASMFIPTFGIIAAAGPIGGLLGGLIVGGIIGGLVDFSVPKNIKHSYKKLVSDGNAVFSMRVDEERMESIIEIVKENGALTIEKY